MGSAFRIHIVCVLIASLSAFGCGESTTDSESPSEDMAIPTEDMQTSINGQSDAGNELEQVDGSLSLDGRVGQSDLGLPDLNDASAGDMNVTPPRSCERTNDCPSPLVCNLGECVDTMRCTTDADCTNIGTICNRGRMRCVLGCRIAAQCPAEEVCELNRCVTGTRCTRDSDCGPQQECEQDFFPGRCVDIDTPGTPDMGMAPDGGIWTCEGTQCESRQRCGPHPSSQCETQTCLGAHGGTCSSNCDCEVSLICRQNTNRCVACLNSLQCDAPEVCIPTGQCGVSINLDEGDTTSPTSLRILQTLRDCDARAQSGGCGQFIWTQTPPQLETLRTEGCQNTIFANAESERESIQDLLRCGGRESPLFIDPSFSGTDASGMLCVTRHRGLFWFHNCGPAAVPID